jgi:magnesium-transporting ATPase (P-type)
MNQTPRDWLLARHADAGPMLDVLRRAALPEARLSGRGFLREIFQPAWPTWATLVAVWVVIVLVQFVQPSQRRRELPLPQYAAAWPTSTTQLDALLEETRTLR